MVVQLIVAQCDTIGPLVEANVHRLTFLTALVLFPVAAVAQQTDVVGGNFQDSTGSGSYKLDVFEVSEDTVLTELEVYLEPSANGSSVWFVVYQAGAVGAGGTTWDLVWDSGATPVSAGAGFKSGGAAAVSLSANEDYAMGVFLPGGNDMTYFYGDVGGDDLGWAFMDRGAYSNNGSSPGQSPGDPVVGLSSSNSPYRMRVTVAFGEDLDGDGYGEFVDCDDNNAAIHPNADEACDGIDNDCDGDVDEDVLYRNVYADLDGDGWGDPNGATQSICEPTLPAGYAERVGDCDDSNAGVNPDEVEICDGLDNNCDGVLGADEGTDADGDGSPSCTDCNDNDPNVWPGRPTDPCNGVDSDCDGKIPESVEECDPLEGGEGLDLASACNCSSGGGSGPGALWLGLGLLAILRRR